MPKLEVRAERPRMDLPKVWTRTPQYLQCPLSLSHISTTKDTQWHFLSSIIRATFYSPLPPPDRLEVAVELLLNRGADVSAEDSSALLDAMRSGQEDTVALLETKGAKKPTLKQLKDALIEVRRDPDHWNFEAAVRMLLDQGTDGNAADSETSLTA